MFKAFGEIKTRIRYQYLSLESNPSFHGRLEDTGKDKQHWHGR
jgi:hypothetical protein